MQRTRIKGVGYIATGVPLPAVNASYYELAPLAELTRTLGTLAATLAVAATITTALGAGAGWFVSGRVIKPLGEVAGAPGPSAAAISTPVCLSRTAISRH